MSSDTKTVTGFITVGDAIGSGPSTWQFSLWDIATDTQLCDLTPISLDAKISVRLNRPLSITLTVPADSSCIWDDWTDGDRKLRTRSRAIKAYRTGDLEGHVIVMAVQPSADENTGNIDIIGYDPMFRLQERTVYDDTGNLVDPAFTSPVSGADLIKQLIDNSTDTTFGDDIVLSGITPLIFPIDTSTGTISSSVDLSAELVDYPMTIGDVATLLTESGALDVVMRPVDSSMGYTAGIMAELNAVDKWGSDKSGYLSFDYGTGRFNVSQARFIEDGSTLSNKITYYLGPRKTKERWAGNITATETVPVDLSAFLALELASRQKFGASATIRVYDSEGDENAARPLFHKLWKTEVTLRDESRQLLYVTPSSEETNFAPFTDYGIGDLVHVNTGPLLGGIEGNQRLYGFDVEVDTDGVERVSELIVSADGE